MVSADETFACRSCGVEVMRLLHERTQNPAPIEVLPPPAGNGNIVVYEDGVHYRIVPKEVREAMSDTERAALLINHFASCPQAQRWGPR